MHITPMERWYPRRWTREHKILHVCVLGALALLILLLSSRLAAAQWNDYWRNDLRQWRDTYWQDRLGPRNFDAGLENEIAEELAAERAGAALEELDAPSMYVDSTDGDVPGDELGTPANPVHPHWPLFVEEDPGYGGFRRHLGVEAYDPDPDFDAYDADPDVEAFDRYRTSPRYYDPDYYDPDAYDPDSYVDRPDPELYDDYEPAYDPYEPGRVDRYDPGFADTDDPRYRGTAHDRYDSGYVDRTAPQVERLRTAERLDADDQMYLPPADEFGPEEEIRTWPQPGGAGWYHDNWHDEWYDWWHDQRFENWFD